MPPSTPQGSVSGGLPVTLCERVCVCVAVTVRWCDVVTLWTDLLSPLSSVRRSVCGSVVKSMASCCSGCVLLLFLPLWAYCCQVKPSTAPSDASSLKSQLLRCLAVYLLYPHLVPACLPISASPPRLAVYFLRLPPYLLS